MSTVTVQMFVFCIPDFFDLMNRRTDPASTQNNILSFFLLRKLGNNSLEKIAHGALDRHLKLVNL